jgi:hypothetical protein
MTSLGLWEPSAVGAEISAFTWTLHRCTVAQLKISASTFSSVIASLEVFPQVDCDEIEGKVRRVSCFMHSAGFGEPYPRDEEDKSSSISSLRSASCSADLPSPVL